MEENDKGKVVVNLAAGLDEPEKVIAAFLVAVSALEMSKPTVIYLTGAAVRFALEEHPGPISDAGSSAPEEAHRTFRI